MLDTVKGSRTIFHIVSKQLRVDTAYKISLHQQHCKKFNPLTPNDHYSGRTAPLTFKVSFYIFIQQIYVLKILNMVYNLRYFFLFKMQFVS